MNDLRLFPKLNFALFLLLFLVSTQQSPAFPPHSAVTQVESGEGQQSKKGRLPVIIVPGLVGSELINEKNQTKAWFSLTRAKDDDLRLPVSPDISANRDGLVPGDVLRTIKVSRFLPEIKIYKGLIESLEKDGYTEGSIDNPGADGFQDTFYVFPYDWRRDNVENARTLLQKLEKIRSKSDQPDLKFHVVAHSMGGLIARYAAMYGESDLSEDTTTPTWDGATYFNSVSLVGTPNGGSFLVLDSLLNGISLSRFLKVNVPFVMDLTKFDLFTIPSIYQLLPHQGLFHVYDENLKPVDADVYDPETWKKYGWLVYEDPKFEKEFGREEQKQAEEYFLTALNRGRLFQKALNAGSSLDSNVRFYNFGAECKSTNNGIVVYQNRKNGNWQTLFAPDSFNKSNGSKVSKESVREVLVSAGDGQVSTRSLYNSFQNRPGPGVTESDFSGSTIVCGYHTFLMEDEDILRGLMKVFNLPERGTIKDKE